MKITTTPGVSIPVNKVCPISTDDRQLIDRKFDKMHANGIIGIGQQGNSTWVSGICGLAYGSFTWKTRRMYINDSKG